MRRTWQWIIGGSAAAVAGIGVAAWYFLVHDVNWARGTLGRMASDRLDRSVALEGNLHVDWGRRTRITVENFRMANAQWGKASDFAAVRRADIVVDARELLRGRLVLPEVTLTEPTLALERRADGEANWTFRAKAAADAATPDDRADMPLIGRLAIENGRLLYDDAKAGVNIDGELSTVSGDGGEGRSTVRLRAQGRLHAEPFRLTMTGGSLLQLREEEEPYPLSLEMSTATTQARVQGTLDDPIKLQGMKLNVELRGDNLGRLAMLTGIPFPETLPYGLKGRLDRDGAVWIVRDMEGGIGKSDVAGWVKVDTGRERLYLEADLKSRRLDYRDIGPLIGVPVKLEGGEAKAVPRQPNKGEDFVRVLPDAPLNIRQVREVDAKVKYRGDKVIAPNTPLDRVELDLDMKDGVLRLKPLNVSMANGDVNADITIDARPAVVRTTYDVRLRKFELSRFLDEAGLKDRGRGRIDGRIQAVGTGNTIAKSLGSADGSMAFAMGGGQISTLALELSGLDLAEAAGFALKGDRQAEIRCLIANFGIEKGAMIPRVLVLDTSDSNIVGEGRIDLASEALDLRFLAHPKDPSPLSARTPITVKGHLGQPSIGIDAAPLATRAAGAVALGVLLTPLAGILAFIEPGLERDNPCPAVGR